MYADLMLSFVYDSVINQQSIVSSEKANPGRPTTLKGPPGPILVNYKKRIASSNMYNVHTCVAPGRFNLPGTGQPLT